MDEMVFLDMLEEMEVAEYNEAGAVRQDLRVIDPLVQLTNEEFRRIYRLTKHLFNFLVQIIEPFMTPKVRNTDLSINEKLLAALRFFATGSYQQDIGQSWYLGISQPSVSRCIHEVIDALNQPEIFNRFVKFPQNRQELDTVRLKFFQRHNMAGVIGCIDCTHIAIFTPHIDDPDYPEHLYVNRKQYHSINTQLICDTDLKILSVNARYPGSTHDAFIWKNSNVYAQLQNLHRNGHTDYLLLGDSGYPLRSWLITPLEEEPPVNTQEHRFNVRHKSTRSLIERCNGVLKMRFRCCLRHRVSHYKPATASKIINSCVILHNLCIEHNLPDVTLGDDEGDEELLNVVLDLGMYNGNNEQENIEDNAARGINPDLLQGRRARRKLIQHFV